MFRLTIKGNETKTIDFQSVNAARYYIFLIKTKKVNINMTGYTIYKI